MVETLALILTFSPGEKEQPLSLFRFADDHPATPVKGFSVGRRAILLLLGEKAGMREVVANRLSTHECGGERAAVQTLHEVRGRPAVATTNWSRAWRDTANDLTLLKVEGRFATLPGAVSRGVKLGGTMASMGFPNIGSQGFAPTEGDG